MSESNETSRWAARAMEHVRVLVDEIGPRPSASPAEREAAEYVHGVMEGDGLNLKDVRHELFPGLPSAHRPLRNCLVMALLGLLFALRGREHGDWWGDFLGVLAVLPGALAAYSAYSIFTLRDWPLYRLMGKRTSQNTVGVVSPAGPAKRTAVLLAHADSRCAALVCRTNRRVSVFRLVIGVAFLALVISPLALLVGAVTEWSLAYSAALVVSVFQVGVLLLLIQADFAPHSPGANDGASGVGVALALAERLREEPLQHTAVWIAITGCEETWDGGVRAMVTVHREALAEALWVEFDGVGDGVHTVWLTGEGMLQYDQAHPGARIIAEAATARLPDLNAIGKPGTLAYTQMGPVHKAGLRGLGINQRPAPGSAGMGRQRLLNDITENIEPEALENALRFGWEVLQVWDEAAD